MIIGFSITCKSQIFNRLVVDRVPTGPEQSHVVHQNKALSIEH